MEYTLAAPPTLSALSHDHDRVPLTLYLSSRQIHVVGSLGPKL